MDKREGIVLFVIVISCIIVTGIIAGIGGYNIGAEKYISQEYNNRFYTEALADFLQIQLLMFPFNESDTVTLEMSDENPLKNVPRFIYINHTEPNPDYIIIDKYVYNYKMHFTYRFTWEEME